MFGTLLIIVTKCISIDDMFRKFDWTTLFVLAGGIGFAGGLDKSGGGRLLADWIGGTFDSAMTPMFIREILLHKIYHMAIAVDWEDRSCRKYWMIITMI
jgi:di/tricarboxylate transporter